MTRSAETAKQLRASQLAETYGFSARHWVKLARLGRIPGARQPSGPRGGWLFDAAEFRRYAEHAGLVPSTMPLEISAPAPRKPLRKSRPTDCVYLLYSIGHVKVGVSSNVTRRKHGFSTASPAPIFLLATIAGSTDLEIAMHRRFASARSRGEWFRMIPEVRAFVLDCQQRAAGHIELQSAEEATKAWLAEISTP